MNETHRYLPGITWRSIGAAVFCLLLMGMYLQYAEIIQVSQGAIGEQALPIPAMTVFVLLLILSGVSKLLVGRRLLTRQEQLCVLFIMLLAAPMMTQGLWHRFVGLIAATPREGNFVYIDALSDKLWPHGRNLLAGRLEAGADGVDAVRGNVAWEDVEFEAGRHAVLPVLRNTRADETASITFHLPTAAGDRPYLIPGEPCLASFLARPTHLDPDSYCFMRLFENESSETYREIITDRQGAEITFLHQKGFRRLGKYGVDIPHGLRGQVRLEIGIQGGGTLEIGDPKFFSVAALEGVYTGRRIIPESEFRLLPEAQRGGLIVKPSRMWSLSGVKFLLSGYIPVRAWAQTAVSWSVPVFLLLLGLLAVGVIMRRQWAESERYAFPLVQIPYAMNGAVEEPADSPFAGIWRRRIMWAGFAVALSWSLLKGWAFYNPKVPNVSIQVPLSQYLSDPSWGNMWNTSFAVSAILVSISIFFELNVLLSLVVGFFLYRMLHWVGRFSGLNVHAGYPFRYEQAIGAYLAYVAVILVFARKHLWRVVKDACLRNRAASGEEAFTYRTAIAIVVAAFVGMALWARWLDVRPGGILLYFFFLMSIGLVTAKFRCECGLPIGYFTPYNAMLFVSLLGGMAAFGAGGLMVCLIASGFLTVSVFFFIPGAQIELLEFGRRYQVVPRHLLYAVLLGILGGLFIGGWVFLSNAYAIGGTNIKYQWSFNQDWFFSSYKRILADATTDFLKAQTQEAVAAPMNPSTWGYVFGAVGTVILAVLRQMFAGFWFHPIGFIVGSAYMLEWAWGSVLTAWCIRTLVLKLGGAVTVKTKLFPCFVGVFLGALTSMLFFVLYGAYLQSVGIERIYSALP